jgi:ankyrin repeat protein
VFVKLKLLFIAMLSTFAFSLNACPKTSGTTLTLQYETGALQWQIARKEIDPNTLIHQAILENELEVINFLISHGVNVDYPNENGMTPLTMAIVNNSTNSVKLLLANGANPNPKVKWNNMTLLELAMVMRDHVSTKLLVEYGADLNVKFKEGSALTKAIGSDWLEIAMLMINKGADICSDDANGPFSMAVGRSMRGNDTRLLSLFLQKGANVNVTFKTAGKPWKTPLIYAASCGQLSIVKFLVESGADVNKSVNPYGNEIHTPLNQAVTGGRVEITQYLLQHGARG